ncbi:hypothetical protein K503DRAFT_725012 [Rhizopogon vinicolor AM-OR11-026]|uniref:F-box domain-containing protein n=1 Tax=Rhizopogon vinicolor AM-OR11-026 TaxID=1314800 RepID=A0A1B7MN64_9AGAM|nr:hypothetical protein K503DRAFT_725012 [Rhizopogon vinicolor AM-OR11-026]
MHPHMVLLIPELLENILSFVDRRENVINACVCKQWSEIAMDLVWREVESLPEFLTLLRPSQTRGVSQNVFDRQPDLRDWARFQKYANRVHILRYRQERADYTCMLDDIARTRTTLDILPNLHTLQWIFKDVKCMERATLFMHQHVRHLAISAPPLKAKTSFFVDACSRMPNLHSLDLRVSYSVRLIEADLLELLRGLPDLKKVIFPEFYLTSAIVSELSRKKHINVIRFEFTPEQGLGEEEDVDSFSPVIEQGAFPMLQDLSITARLEDITRFMGADFAPIHITCLYIHTYVELEPEELHTLLVMLSKQCCLLSELYTKLLDVHNRRKLVSAKQITFDTLRPVLSFPHLTTFEVMHKYPVNISLEEIEELASQWPTLGSLSLNEEPLAMHDFTLDLRALVPFARHCPNLFSLGLFMDAIAPQIHPAQELIPFTALEVLFVGTSRAREPGAVAAFLSCLCPPGCEIDAVVTWTSYGSRSCCELDNTVLDIGNRSASWKSVSDLLPLFIQVRREEREKSKALREEVEYLRAKNRLPMDKDNIRANGSCTI